MAVVAMLLVSVLGLAMTLSGTLSGFEAVPALGLYAFVAFGALLFVSVGMLFMGQTPSFGQLLAQLRGEIDGTSDAAHGARRHGAHGSAAKSLLVVDDDPFVLELVKVIAGHSGYDKVTTVSSAYEALQLIQSPIQFDGFLLDIGMPGMNGIELCREIRAHRDYSETPVLMLTAMRDLRHMTDAYKAGASDYASKPFEVGELESRLREMQSTTMRPWKRDAEIAIAQHPVLQPNPTTLPPLHAAAADLKSDTRDIVTLQAYKNFLTQLPNTRLEEVQVFAIWGDWQDQSARSLKSLPALTMSGEDLFQAAVSTFKPVQTLMTLTENGALLVAHLEPDEIKPGVIERTFERALQEIAREASPGAKRVPIVSVGRPVLPTGARPERADQTIAKAMANANSRRANKVSPSRKPVQFLRKLS